MQDPHMAPATNAIIKRAGSHEPQNEEMGSDWKDWFPSAEVLTAAIDGTATVLKLGGVC